MGMCTSDAYELACACRFRAMHGPGLALELENEPECDGNAMSCTVNSMVVDD